MKKNWFNDEGHSRSLFKWLRVMKLTMFFLLAAFLQVSASVYSQQTKLSITLQNASVKEVLKHIENQSDFFFLYKNENIDVNRIVSIDIIDKSVEDLLDQLFKGTKVSYEVVNRQIVLVNKENGEFITQVQQQVKKVTGKVTDSTGGSMPGVSVVVKGTNTGVITDSDGNYSLPNIPENATLRFSFVGMKMQEVAVGNKTAINVTLADESIGIEEVVAIGYGTQKKKDLTGAISSIDSKQIEKLQTNGIDKALQGQIAGLQISSTSGSPGGNTTILVRGISSITGGVEPLFVVDGYPVTNVGYSNPLSTINPNDIESVDVLKDASSTAIYGSRGSNGVIIITTKRGKIGKPKIEFDLYSGVQEVAHRIDMMNARQFSQMLIDARNNGYLENTPTGNINDDNSKRGNSYKITDKYKDAAFLESIGEGTDWQDAIFRQALIQNYQLAISGGNEGVKYSISGGYFNQDGVVIKTNFKRYSFKANIDAQINKKFSVGITMLPSFSREVSPPITGHYGGFGIINTALAEDPTVPVYNADGTYSTTYISTDGNASMANPVKIANEYSIKNSQSRLFTNAYAEYVILPALKIKTSMGTDVNYFKTSNYKPLTLSGSSATAPATATITNNEAINWLSETTLSFKKTFSNVHQLDAVAGFTAQSDHFDAVTTNATNFPDDLIPNINGGTVTSGGEIIATNNLLSVFTRANYSYKGKYLLTATVRQDGSSRFGGNRRWGTFPSGSLGWKVSEESFMKSIRLISDLKLRTSYGVTGNNAIGDYRALGLVNSSNYVIGDALTPGAIPGSLPNPSLGWESQSQLDLGIDLSLFKNRISIIADWYDKRNKDMLFNVQTPSVTGFTNAIVNLGEVQNKGIEFAVNTRNLVNKFKWTTNFNITFNKNKVLAMSTANDKIYGNTGGRGNSNVTMVGEAIGVFYGKRFLGVFNSDEEAKAYGAEPFAKAGDFKFKDVDNNKKIDDNDREVIGSPHPKYFFGFNNTFSYKNFSLDVLTNGMMGQKVFASLFALNNSGVQNNMAFIDEARWRSADQPGSGKYGSFGRSIRGGKNDNFAYSSWSLFDASFFRIKQITLNYNIPSHIVKYLKLESARCYAGVSNVYTFTNYPGYDPEVGNGGDTQTVLGVDFGTYPSARTYTLGINFSF
jgi:TonB-linked SusC/RagA family outer membrane protein